MEHGARLKAGGHLRSLRDHQSCDAKQSRHKGWMGEHLQLGFDSLCCCPPSVITTPERMVNEYLSQNFPLSTIAAIHSDLS